MCVWCVCMCMRQRERGRGREGERESNKMETDGKRRKFVSHKLLEILGVFCAASTLSLECFIFISKLAHLKEVKMPFQEYQGV